MNITAIPAFEDNYIWVMHDSEDHAIVVDPGDAEALQPWLAEGFKPVAYFITHHHRDHIGGMEALLQQAPAPCYAPADARITFAHKAVGEGDVIEVPALGRGFTVMEVPAHTRSHIAFVGDGQLFCGDTLFRLGCGRLFEGDAAQLHDALQRFAALPDDTQVFCTHEYTLANAAFVAHTLGLDDDLRQELAIITGRLNQGQPSLPSTIGFEKRFNPFVQPNRADVQAFAQEQLGRPPKDAVEALACLRSAKDRF